MKIEIKNRWTGLTIYECEAETIREALEQAANQKVNLRGADLGGADLSGADLSGAVLRDADLRGADLRGADLGGAVLGGAVLSGADLRGADLGGAVLGGAVLRGADLSGADLRGADLSGADLSGAVLRDADLRGADLGGAVLGGAVLRGGLNGVPKIENIHKSVYEAASKPEALDMGSWHVCETTHCRAGWVIALAGAAGKAMEFCMGTPAAAALIYMASDPKLEKIPNFYSTDDEALADMKRLAEAQS